MLSFSNHSKFLRIGKSRPQITTMTQRNNIAGIIFRMIFFFPAEASQNPHDFTAVEHIKQQMT